MELERVSHLMSFVNKKLCERNVKNLDHEAAIKALSGCVLANQLITAYKIHNGINP